MPERVSAGMRIEAIRLREVGLFRTAQQLAGLGPGLNLFAGANELGKSTIFRGLRALFEEPYTANNKTVRELRSDHGGAPLVECDFETAGQRWRLTKQYLAGKTAELRRLDGDKVYRGPDVDPALDEIMAAAFGNRAATHLLWVAQGESFEPPVPSTAMRQTFEQLVRTEAEAAGGGAQLAHLLNAVRKNLFALVTEKTRQPKTGGGYAAAVTARNELRDLHQLAQDKVEASAQRRQRLVEIEERLGVLNSPQHNAQQDQQIADLRKALDEAQQARAKADLAAEQVKALTVECTAAKQRLERFNKLSAEQVDITKRRTALTGEQDESKVLASAAEAEQQAAENEQRELGQRRDELQVRKINAQRLAHRQSLVDHQVALEQRLEQAQVVLAEQQRLAALHQAIAIDEDAVEQLETLYANTAALEAQIALTAATATVDYEAGHQSDFHLNGEIVSDKAELIVDRPMTLSVPGVGSITLRPAANADGEQPVERLASIRDQIIKLQSKTGVETLEEARSSMRTKRYLKSQLDAQSASLHSIAPEGIDALEKERETAVGKIDGFGQIASADLDQLETDGVEIAALLKSAADRVRKAVKARADVRERDVARASELAALANRHDAIAADLPALPKARANCQTELERTAAAATNALNAATRELSAWLEAAPEAAALSATKSELSRLEAGRKAERQQVADLREELRGLEGALARDLEDGIEVEAQDLADKLVFADARLAEIVRDVAALDLLERELASERERQANMTTGPISERLTKLAGRVLPDSRFQLGQDLAVAGLQRGQRDERTAQLSGGTREQIAVLARLAYAGLLAENGHSVPLLLDDALAFSDDHRLDLVFEELAAAAQCHQVILLTCHARNFAPLVEQHGATNLQLTPWL